MVLQLSNQEYIQLAKGLKYIPTRSSENAIMSVNKAYNDFDTKLELSYQPIETTV